MNTEQAIWNDSWRKATEAAAEYRKTAPNTIELTIEEAILLAHLEGVVERNELLRHSSPPRRS